MVKSELPAAASSTRSATPSEKKGPLLGVIWFALTIVAFAVISASENYNVIHLIIGWRSVIALGGYLVMQVGLWNAETKWDEEGSAAYLEAAGKDKGTAPEELEAMDMGEVTIPKEKMIAAFPVPWGFLLGWWIWGISYIFPIDGSLDLQPTPYGKGALLVCFLVSYVASIPMSDAVMNRLPTKKMAYSLMFLVGWITLGVLSSLDVTTQLTAANSPYDQYGVWVLCMMGPFTVILSQKILFGARKMGTLWEASGKPNFHPIVYNMGGPLFVWGWFLFLLGTSGLPGKMASPDICIEKGAPYYIPLFMNWRTLLAFVSGCGMVPIVGFLDYSHDEDGPWCGENKEGKVFKTWYLGTDGTYFGLFLESPWPFILAWTTFGFSSFLTADNSLNVGIREKIIFVNCVLQGIDAGILIQQNLYAGNKAGKNKFSIPFVLLFIALAINIGSSWGWRAIALSVPGAMLIILGQKTVFGARKRGDYTMENGGKANPYDRVFVYSWGEVFFMLGWILICWGVSLP